MPLYQFLFLLFSLTFASASCPPGKFGLSCQHECYCQDGCDLTNGSCLIGECMEGFYGPTCQKKNVALRQFANASSLWPGCRNCTPDKAVDGDTSQLLEQQSCFHSNTGQKSSEWRVFLDDIYPMDNIVIYYRTTWLQRLRNAQLIVANTSGTEQLCRTFDYARNKDNNILAVTCPSLGDQLLFRQVEGCGECLLELCEVQIFVCNPGFSGLDCGEECQHGFYGVNCRSECGHCDCDSVNGSCLGDCHLGWTEASGCYDGCPEGWYGANCSQICGQCRKNETCDHVTGQCRCGCDPGYTGDTCDECHAGWYGVGCSHWCGHCHNNEPCNHISGYCRAGCRSGWTGDTCSEMEPSDSFGILTTEMPADGASNTSVGALTGAFLGGAMSAVLIVAIIWICRRRKRNSNFVTVNKFSELNNSTSSPSDPNVEATFDSTSNQDLLVIGY